MCTTVGFDASFDSERTFLMDFFRQKMSKHRILKDLSTLPTTFCTLIDTKKSKLGFVTPIGLPGKAVQSFSGYALFEIGGLAKVLF